MNKNYFIIMSCIIILYLMYKVNEGFTCVDPSNAIQINYGDKTNPLSKCYNVGTYDLTDFSNNKWCQIEYSPNYENAHVSLYNEYDPNLKINQPNTTLTKDTTLYSSCYPNHMNITYNPPQII